MIRSYDAKRNGNLVTIIVNGETRIFQVYSARAGSTLELLVKKFTDGITSEDMKETYGISDNKMFDELKHASGFALFMIKDENRRNNLNVWKIDLEKLWKSTEGLPSPIWFGKQEQISLQQFLPALEKKYGLKCNLTGIPLLKNSENTFASNLRAIAIDHRRPKLKNGTDELENLQLLSHYINERKNQICAECTTPECEKCALAFPEKTSVIFPTDEDISFFEGFKNKKK